MNVSIQNLHKTYRGNFQALRDVNLEINTGMTEKDDRNLAGYDFATPNPIEPVATAATLFRYASIDRKSSMVNLPTRWVC